MINARTEELAARLQSNSLRLLRLVRRDGAGQAISGPKLSVLSFLGTSGPASLASLAAAEQVQAPTMSRLVEGLVEEGLVTRETHATDRRKVRIAITEAGRALLSDGEVERVAALASRLRRLADSERRALARGVELMERLLKAA